MYNLEHMDYDNSLVKCNCWKDMENFMQKVRDKPHNILFTIQKLANVMGKAPLLLQKGIT